MLLLQFSWAFGYELAINLRF